MDYIKELENNITDYFKEEVLDFMHRNQGMSLKEAVNTWADRYSAIYNTPSYINGFVEERLNPSFGITYTTLQETLRSEGTTFMKYVESLLKEELLGNNNIFGSDEDESSAKEEADDIKKEIINDTLGDEVNLDNLDGEELDIVLGKIRNLTKVNEKVSVIKESLKDKDSDYIAKVVSKGTGMTLKESKMALEMLDE